MNFLLRTIVLLIVVGWTVTIPLKAEKTLNINNEQTLKTVRLRASQKPAKRNFLAKEQQFRDFDINPALKKLTKNNTGDILLLDFFDNKQYQAEIQTVTHNINGVTGITAKIKNTNFGFCYLSISEEGILINAELPESDEHFMATGTNGDFYLTEYKMSDLAKNELACEELFPSEKTNSESSSGLGGINYTSAQATAENCTAGSGLNDAATINVLVVYTLNAKTYADNNLGGIANAINQAMQKSNQAAANSETGITFNLAYSYQTNYTEANSDDDLSRLQNPSDGYMDEVHTLRKQYNADLVQLIPSVTFTGGLGYVLTTESGFPNWAFALSRIEQISWTYTMVHEIGHNMGCAHHKLQGGNGLYSYSYGWRGTNNQGEKFSTVMTYENFDDQGDFPNIPYFSDPNIIVGGVPIGDVNDGNNALTLRRTKHITALYSDALNIALSGLSVNSGTLSPDFNAATTSYTVSVPNSVSSITLTGTANHSCATVTGNGSKDLNVGNNTFTITVNLAGISKSYTVTVNKTPSQVVPPPSHTVIAGKVHLSGPMRSEVPVHIYATADTGKVDIDNTNASAMLMADTIILYSNDTYDGLIRNLNTKGGGVKGTVTDNPNQVIVRKNFADSKWTYISFPYDVASVNVIKDAAQLPGGGTGNIGYWAYGWDNVTRADSANPTIPQIWKQIDYTANTVFKAGAGYQIWYENAGADGTVDFVSEDGPAIATLFSPAAKTVKFDKYKTDQAWDHPDLGAGWALIGALNSTTFTISDTTVAYGGATVYYRKSKTSQADGSLTAHGSFGECVIAKKETAVDLSPYTPFYIQDNSGTTAGQTVIGNFTFYSDKGLSIESSKFRSSKADPADQFKFILSSDKDDLFDRFYLDFDESFSEDYLTSKDAVKLSTRFAGSPTVWSLQNGQPLVLSGLPLKDEREVKIGFSVPEAGDYTFTVNELVRQNVRNLILIDNVVGRKVDLLQTPYSFTAAEVSGNTERFVLLVNSSYTDIPAIEGNAVYAYVKDNLLTVKNLSEGDRIQVVDLAGRIIILDKISGNEFSCILNRKGAYIVQVKGEKETVLKILNK
ncbi:hypothetical protein FACS189446_2070 [Bacteroidia bacterium]|nr:hypothetical protein FACS189446_2070 [Bacteroidia bacterium]